MDGDAGWKESVAAVSDVQETMQQMIRNRALDNIEFILTQLLCK